MTSLREALSETTDPAMTREKRSPLSNRAVVLSRHSECMATLSVAELTHHSEAKR